MPELLERIEKIIERELHKAPDDASDLLTAIIPVWENRPKYCLDGQERLIGLNLAGIGLTDKQWDALQKEAGFIGNIQALNLGMNNLTRFHISHEWHALKGLCLYENQALSSVTLPNSLPNLVFLDASRCALSEITIPDGFRTPPKDSGLPVPPSVYLQQNKLEKIIFRGPCRGLVLLHLSNNNLANLQFGEGFDALRYLYLQGNKLKSLGFAVPLRQLNTLHLKNNELSELPHNLLSLTALQTLYLHGNKFGEILSANIPTGERENAYKRVSDYLSNLTQGKMPNERVKIIIVGNGRVGKTSLFKMLKTGQYDPNEPYTHGVSLGKLDKSDLGNEIKSPGLHAYVWDFGGQEIFYATHQFFLTDGALYILAWTAQENVREYRKYDQGKIGSSEKWRDEAYWLEDIRRHSKKSPLLMVQTHTDRIENLQTFNNEFAKEPYNATPIDFSAANPETLGLLKKRIAYLLNEKIPRLKEDIPLAYDKVIGIIESKKDENRVKLQDFFGVCRDAQVQPDTEISLLKFLHETGAVIWFERVKGLKDTVFVNPDWLMKRVYSLVNPELADTKGEFGQKWIEAALPAPDYSKEDRDQIIELLLNFNLIFELKDRPGTFIAPQHLPPTLEQSDKKLFEKTKRRTAHAFDFRFPRFIPENVMINFLSTYGPYADTLPWKNGIAFAKLPELKGAATTEIDCTVELAEDGKTLSVHTTPGEESYPLQAEICRAFVELGKNTNAEIALPGQPYVSWHDLEDAFNAPTGTVVPTIRACDGQSWVLVEAYKRFFEATDSIKQMEPKLPTPTPKLPKQEIYFSYAWGKDPDTGENLETLVDELYKSIEADGRYKPMRDKADNGYGKSIRDFMKKIGHSNFVVVFLSKKYLQRPNCMFELLQGYLQAGSESEAFRAKIFPIVLGDPKIYEPEDRIDHILYWQNKCKALDKKLANLTRENARAIQPDYDVYVEIKNHIGKLSGILSDINNLDPETLSQNNFEIIKNAIDKHAEKMRVNQASSTPNAQLDRMENMISLIKKDTAALLESDAIQQGLLSRLLDEKTTREAFFEKIEKGMDALLPKLSTGDPLQQEIEDFKSAPDVKTKIKLALHLLFFTVEKEISWDMKGVFREIYQDFKNGHIFIKP